MPIEVKADPSSCFYPQSNPTSQPIRSMIEGIAENKHKCQSFYLDTLEKQSKHLTEQENHHQGLARTHRLSDGSIYFFLSHSNLTSYVSGDMTSFRGNLMQFRYTGPTDDEHIVETTPRTVAPMKQLINLDDPHPSDIVFLPEVNGEDAGYLFVTEEFVQYRVSIYRWEPSGFLELHGRITQWFPQGGPNFVFIDKIGDHYYLGLANSNAGQVRLLRAECSHLFPRSQRGAMNVSAFKPLEPQSTFPFLHPAPDHTPSQVKLIKDSTGQWFLLAFRSDPDYDENGADYIDVYAVDFTPFSISSLVFSQHVFFKPGDTGFASTGTHYVEKSGRLLVASSYRYSEDEGPGDSSYVSRVDECASS